MVDAKSAATTLETADVISAPSAKKRFVAMRQNARIAGMRWTMSSSSTLRIAYTAVRAQRINADLRKSWFDEEMREAYVAAEMDLEAALREADRQKEIDARGGEKQKFVK